MADDKKAENCRKYEKKGKKEKKTLRNARNKNVKEDKKTNEICKQVYIVNYNETTTE